MTALQEEQGFVLWLTGLPASGKSSLARELRRLLAERGIRAVILDSDELRSVLTPRPMYTEDEREWFYGVIAYLGAWLAKSGVNVLIAATAHRRFYRDRAREQIERFAEVYVHCPLEVCRRRDRKGIYALAYAGRAPTVPGVGVAYEPPLNPEAVVDTAGLGPVEASIAVLSQIEEIVQKPGGESHVNDHPE